MPSLVAIAKYWYARGGPFDVDLSAPACFGCGEIADIEEPAPPPTVEELRANLAEFREAYEAGQVSQAMMNAVERARAEQIAKLERGPSPKSLDSQLWRWHAASSSLERAHLITRVFDGLDGEQNIVPLCGLCHRVMPSFKPGQEDAAFDYVLNGGWPSVVLPRLEGGGNGWTA